MTTGKGNEVPVDFGTDKGEDFAEAWSDLRADENIQFTEIDVPEPDPPPRWLEEFFDWLGNVMQPVGETLVDIWPVLMWALIAVGVLLVGYFLFRIFAPISSQERSKSGGETEWVPEESEALALLEEADRLATEGRFDEATHLLLKRSVGQIAAARPSLVEPSSTARELSADQRLPEAARSAFAVIAGRVERSLFALTRLNQDDWTVARDAYAQFALQQQALST